MSGTEPIRIEGLAQFSRNLKKISSDLPKALRVAMNDAANVVIGDAVPRVPKRTGRAAKSIKARSTRTAVRVGMGGTRALHAPWLDFGGEGRRRGRPPKRPFIKEGRYLYKSYFKKRDSGEIQQVMNRALLDVARQAGVEVT